MARRAEIWQKRSKTIGISEAIPRDMVLLYAKEQQQKQS